MRTIFWFTTIILATSFVLSCSDKASEKEYFDLATQYMDQQDWEKAEEYFNKVLQDYPNGLFSSKALFMVGYLNANHMKNFDKARKYYTEFLEKYPDHELADAARYELDNMGKDVDELPFMQEEQSTEPSASQQSAQKEEPSSTN
jgi:outer membrane protein assembly factor BamD (BamD/ComL family)